MGMTKREKLKIEVSMAIDTPTEPDKKLSGSVVSDMLILEPSKVKYCNG